MSGLRKWIGADVDSGPFVFGERGAAEPQRIIVWHSPVRAGTDGPESCGYRILAFDSARPDVRRYPMSDADAERYRATPDMALPPRYAGAD